ncbi:MAG: 30S ribosomal protein S20 [Candidatus Kapabacteria bacterium]|nr:30S ribosomal protein S20 [Candidatus Kapabacteria bacterium]
MAHHKSSLKRIRQTKKLRLYNRLKRKTYKSVIRDVRETKTYEEALVKLQTAYSVLDRVAAKGILHKNNAANRKARLSAYVHSLKVA